MKKITLFLLLSIVLCAANNLYAQSWNIGGNPNANVPAAGGRLGTNGDRPVIFETNNTERARLLNGNGFWGFGTTAPNTRVHINSLTGENPFRVQVAGASKLYVDNGGGVSVGSSSIPPANGLFVSGNVGIGTSVPAVKLHVTGGSDAAPSGGGFIVSGAITGANISIDDNEIMARSNGVASDLFLNQNGANLIVNGTNSAGSVGIGTSSPANRLHIKQAIANRAIEFQHESTTDFWTVGIGTSTLNCRFEFNGIGKGQISSVDGSYSTISDARLKEDIQPMSSLLDKIMKLKPSNYYYKDSRSIAKNKSIGFIAQEVEKVFPELVYNEDEGYKWLNYTGFAVISIKGLQELQPIVEEQKLKIATLEERIAKLESALNAISSTKFPSGIDASSVTLEQNQPNPFNQTTIIRYKIPSGINAQINIYNANGAMVRTMRAPENGQAQINAGDLKAGTYTYALLVDGKPLASKKMIMLK
ncbi:hypothetical protein BH10BAC2_BH10BAC2_49170 [soil metagenome]